MHTRSCTYDVLGAARIMKLLGAGVLLMAVRSGAFVVTPPANSARRVAYPAGSPASQTAVRARAGRCVRYLAQ